MYPDTSATPASRPIASLTALKLRSRAKTSVTSEIRSTNTNERMRRNESCSACRTDRKNTDALVTEVETSHRTYSSGRRGRRGRYLSTTGTPPVSSDARTNGRDPRADVFARVAERAGRTFWLNPEPRLYWNYGDSVIAAYEQFCEAYECWTTRQLEDFVKALTAPSAQHS